MAENLEWVQRNAERQKHRQVSREEEPKPLLNDAEKMHFRNANAVYLPDEIIMFLATFCRVLSNGMRDSHPQSLV